MENTKQYDRDLILQAIRDNQLTQVIGEVQNAHPADIADLLDELPTREALIVFGRLPVVIASEVLDETSSLVRKEVISEVPDEHLADIFDELPVDDAVEILEDLPQEVSAQIIELMEPEEAQYVKESLTYEKESAGRLMNSEVATLRIGWTAKEARHHLRTLEEVDTNLDHFFVTDEQDHLIGVVHVLDLLMEPAAEPIEHIMQRETITANVNTDQEELAHIMAKYDVGDLAIVDDQNRLLGVVTVDDIIDVIEEEATEDIQRLGGSEPLEQPYFQVTTLSVFRKRIGWLLLFFFAGTITGFVSRAFEGIWGQFLILASFVPLVIGTGGNSGSQTIATVIRAITTDEVRFQNIFQAWRREITIGFMLGTVLGGLGVVFMVLFWDVSWTIGIVVGLTLLVVVVWSITIGTLVPIIAERIGIDPTVVSGPMLTTIVDVTGLAIYYSLAGLLLGVF
jgi:magnesium transporter